MKFRTRLYEFLAALVAIDALGVLIFWLSGNNAPASSQYFLMNPINATSMILLSGIVLTKKRLFIISMAFPIIFATVLVLIDYMTRSHFNIDTRFFATQGIRRVAPNTAISLLFLALHSIMPGLRKSLIVLIMPAALGMMTIWGYILGIKHYYEIGFFSPMALDTAITILLLSLAFLLRELELRKSITKLLNS